MISYHYATTLPSLSSESGQRHFLGTFQLLISISAVHLHAHTFFIRERFLDPVISALHSSWLMTARPGEDKQHEVILVVNIHLQPAVSLCLI